MADFDYSDSNLANLESQRGLPPGLMKTVEHLETGSSKDPMNAVSPTGAVGPMQVLPSTAAKPGYGIAGGRNPRDPTLSADYLAHLYKQSGGSVEKTLAMYNAGPGGNFNNPETQKYVRNGLAHYQETAPVIVKLPDGRVAQFPNTMSKDEIAAVIKKTLNWKPPTAKQETPKVESKPKQNSDIMTKEEYSKLSLLAKVGAPKPGESKSNYGKVLADADASTTMDALMGGGILPGAATVAKNTAPLVDRAVESVVPDVAKGWKNSAQKWLGWTHGGREPITKWFTKTKEEYSKTIDKIAADIHGAKNDVAAGRLIKKAISGEGGWLEKGKVLEDKLYSKVIAGAPASVAPQHTLKYLDDTIGGAAGKVLGSGGLGKIRYNLAALAEAGAEGDKLPAELSEAFRPTNKARLAESFDRPKAVRSTNKARLAEAELAKKATNKARLAETEDEGGSLSFEQLKEIRSKVGDHISSGVATDTTQKEWRGFYRALSKDMEESISLAKDPKTAQLWRRANAFTTYKMSAVEDIFNPLLKGMPEEIFQHAFNKVTGPNSGPTKITSIMHALRPEQRNVVRGAFLRNLGRNPDGSFSFTKYLGDWRNINVDAKKAIFGGSSTQVMHDLDKIAKNAEHLHTVERTVDPASTGDVRYYKTFGNFILHGATVGAAALGALATGGLGGAAIGVGSEYLGTKVLAKLATREGVREAMNNPHILHFIASNLNSRITPKLMQGFLHQVGQDPYFQEQEKNEQADAEQPIEGAE